MLADRAVIGVSGPEARPFLQGLLTNDINLLAPDRPLYAALLAPQGKILFEFLIYDGGGDVLIDCHKDSRAALIKRLTLYRLRAQIEIAARDDCVVVADQGPDDPRLKTLGQRAIVAAATETVDGTDAWHDWRWSLGVPEGADFGSDQVFAMDGGLDELNAISFTKGCYVGQELTARMKHRGTDRKRLLPVQSTPAPLPAAGTPMTADGADVGTLMSSYGDCGFALVRLDRLGDATSAQVGGIKVSVIRPEWLFH